MTMTAVAAKTKATCPIPRAVPKFAAPSAAASAVVTAKAARAMPMSVSVAMHLG
jgi:hypothetical protein